MESAKKQETLEKFCSLFRGRALIASSDAAYDVLREASEYIATCIEHFHERYKGDCAHIEIVGMSRVYANTAQEELRGFWDTSFAEDLKLE